jgi:hypothetical protein
MLLQLLATLYQDDDVPVVSLSLVLWLNVEADQLASEFLQENEQQRPIALLLPTVKCQLIASKWKTSNSENTTANLKQEAWTSAITSWKCNKWTEQTLDDINWDAHGQVMQLINHTKDTSSSSVTGTFWLGRHSPEGTISTHPLAQVVESTRTPSCTICNAKPHPNWNGVSGHLHRWDNKLRHSAWTPIYKNC